MSHLVDIALGESGRLTAIAAELRVARGTLFLIMESSSADPAAAPLVQAALSAFAGTAACSPATSPARMLDQAFDSANKAAHEAIGRNRSLQGILISASAVLSTGGHLHVASVGANGVYLRTQGQTRRLAEPETPSSRLAVHGLSPDETRNVDNAAVNGLGLPPEVFSLRQSRSFPEPDSYLLVLCGAGIDSLITPAHISTTSPATGDMSVTATRLFRQFGDRLMTPSAVLAAHRRTSTVESTPFRYSVNGGERPARRFAGPLPFALLAVAVLGILVYIYLDRKDRQDPPAPIAPPANLLQTGSGSAQTGSGSAQEGMPTDAPSRGGGPAAIDEAAAPDSPVAPPGDLPPPSPESGTASPSPVLSPVSPAPADADVSSGDGGAVPSGTPAEGAPASSREGRSDNLGAKPLPAAAGGRNPRSPVPAAGKGRSPAKAPPSAGASAVPAGTEPPALDGPPAPEGAAATNGAAATGGPPAPEGAAATGGPSAPEGAAATEGTPAANGEAAAAAPGGPATEGEAAASSPDGPGTTGDPAAPAPEDSGTPGDPAAPSPEDSGTPGAPAAPAPGDFGTPGAPAAPAPDAAPEGNFPESPSGDQLPPDAQVMDFTKPDPDDTGARDAPAHRPFPSVRLEPDPLPPGGVEDDGLPTAEDGQGGTEL